MRAKGQGAHREPALSAWDADRMANRRVDDVSNGELLVALLEGWCLAAVVPLALVVVEENPLTSAGCFPGDLLRGLMEVPGGFWARYPRLYDRYREALRAGSWLRRGLPPDERMEFWSVLDQERMASAGLIPVDRSRWSAPIEESE